MFWLDPFTQKRHYLGRSFTHNNIQYTSAGANESTFISLGFQKVTVAERPDDRFYIVSGPDSFGAYSSTPRNLDDLKSYYIKQSKLSARAILSKTDWLVIRKEENTNAIPAPVASFRDQVRVTSDDNCTLINGCADVAALEALVNAPTTVLSDPNDLTSPMIANSDPHLSAYPEEVDGYDY